MRSSPARLALAAVCTLALAAAAPAAFGAAQSHPAASTATASFDAGTQGWTGIGARLTTTTRPVRTAPGALVATRTGDAPNLSVVSAPVAVTSGSRSTGRAWVRAGNHVRRVSAALVFKASSGATRAMVWGQPVADSTTGWVLTPAAVGLVPRGTATVQLVVLVWGGVTGERAYVDDASVVTGPASSVGVTGPLHVRGNTLVDGAGRPLLLRGVQRFGLEGGTRTPPPSDAEIAQLKAWGANEVRISLGEQFWVPASCAYDPAYRSKVDRVVHSVTSRGMVALVNLHYSVTRPCGKPGLQPMADAALSVPFWKDVAARYANNPLVAFDLYNEPHDVTEAVWLGGGPVTWQGQTYQAAGMQQLYNVVRSTGAKNVVVVSGLDWASRPPAAPLVSGSDIVYGAHAYTCPHSPPPACGSRAPYNPSGVLDAWLTLGNVAPVMVTEFGWPDRHDGTYLANVIGYAEAHHWGWDAFAFDGSTTGLFDLVDGVAADGSTYEPTASGMAVVTGLAANGAAAATSPKVSARDAVSDVVRELHRLRAR